MNPHTEQTPRPASSDPQTIERQNERIRADMGETLQALERKLSPGQLLDRSLALFTEHGGEMATNLGRSVKANPVPVLLTAVGLCWLMAAKRTPATSDEISDGVGEDSSARDTFDAAKEQLGATGAQLREGVQSTRARVRRSAASVRDAVHAAKDRTHAVADSARRQTRRAREAFDTLLEEQPLALGAIGIAVGVAIGALLPATKAEGRLMGEARNRVLDRVREEGREQYEKVRDTALHATDAAVNAAKDAVAEEPRAH